MKIAAGIVGCLVETGRDPLDEQFTSFASNYALLTVFVCFKIFSAAALPRVKESVLEGPPKYINIE